MKPTRIPLFPLDVVLFPGLALPLHIFEPRYKLMIRRCLDMKAEFGVILAQERGMATVGCTASILAVAKQYADGRMDILTRGETRFQTKEIFDKNPYYEAEVDYQEELTKRYPAASNELTELYEQCYWLFFNRGPQIDPANANLSPTYVMAAALPLELDQKQVLLEMREETQRQSELHEQLKGWLPRLLSVKERRKRAGGNGQCLN